MVTTTCNVLHENMRNSKSCPTLFYPASENLVKNSVTINPTKPTCDEI